MAKVTEELVRRILFDGRAGPRLLNESSVQIDVWNCFADESSGPVDLLLVPFDKTPAQSLALDLHEALKKKPLEDSRRPRHITPIEGAVAALLSLDDFLFEVLPRTGIELGTSLRTLLDMMLSRRISEQVEGRSSRRAGTINATPQLTGTDLFAFLNENRGRLSPEVRLAALVVVLLFARGLKYGGYIPKDPLAEGTPRAVKDAVSGKLPDLHPYLEHGFALDTDLQIWRVALNRKVNRLGTSISTIKADAAHRAFDIDCRSITWAVIDSGIDASHPAFRDHDIGNFATRVDKAYDFASMRKMASFDTLADTAGYKQLVKGVAHKLVVSEEQAEDMLDKLRHDAEAGRPFDWQVLADLLEVPTDWLPPDESGKPDGHGTHVAGVLAGDWRENDTSVYRGVCPNIRLLDLRVLGDSEADTEFAVIAALAFVRWLNARNRYVSVHGVNLSIGLKHDRDYYACGRTPVCVACDATVSSGVSVVAAAGNWGAQQFTTHDGNYPGYASISISDPGNAVSVITVGATHRDRPHEYGVSFFSSRGPTADGRAKPDVVAPGERIDGPLPNLGFGRLDGTSMAAPHVSGISALLMARHPELIGKPDRVKAVIVESATNLGREPYFQGAGLVDAFRALQRV